ncbi:NAD(P)/FAD-dependent oxidoreductase [Aminipila terrae]|uniref:FAD-dependent oxidoreductase n=1 Tax=Aminipila terrae TaxID=2697030 RepID=A0A6P1MI45_9FIRM|nr:FAD-dependent oxidoreductase [Aminipila terrae]QHI73411.1 FAD-dependent oxidoreductase [Aminipila terrae]
MRHVIIGAGAAGLTAARRIRELDSTAEIVVISRDEHVHSRCMLHKYLSGERDERTLNFVSPDFFEKNRITWIKSAEVQAIVPDRKNVVLGDNQMVCYDKLLIATGADSFIPPVGDFRTAGNVFGLRNLSDAQEIVKHIKPQGKVIIVGSGLVGMDAAYGLLEKKMDVTVVEMADRILPIQLDEAAGNEYKKLFEKAGCKFILNRKASETILDSQNNVSQLILDDKTVLDCDVIIVAAGVRPAIACTIESGIDVEKNIKVNEYMETSVRDIYAAGDVAGMSGIWPNAMKQGCTAAENMCGNRTAYEDTYAMKNTINFFGLVTLSLGRGQVQEGDKVVIREDSKCYKRAIIREDKLDSVLLQGNMDYAGVYQYLIKNNIKLKAEDDIFKKSFADYYKVRTDGQYEYNL